ncbi:MAG: hypothetical protein RJQ04_02975, partial [Longimicrobiales bacterium]
VASDALAEAWFHGLAAVGLTGFGAWPLVAPPEPPNGARAAAVGLRDALEADPAFEVLHFLPLYMRGADAGAALGALQRVLDGADPSETAPETRRGAEVVAAFFSTTHQRAVLAAFLEQVEAFPPAPPSEGTRRAVDAALRTRWTRVVAPALAGFLVREGMESGTIVPVGALGPEGRFLARDPTAPDRVVVAVARPADTSDAAIDAALGAVVREICHPAVRRAFGPLEARTRDRRQAARVSDHTATRCGLLLLQARVPDLVPAYRARFGLDQGSDRAFLTAAGLPAGVAALEGPLEEALRRQLHLHDDQPWAPRPPVRRNP